MQNWRINFIFIVIVVVALTIISRLFYLQVLNHKFYLAQALGQQAILSDTEGARGEVFFLDNSKSFAINNDKWSLYAVPNEIEDKEGVSNKLSEIIGETSELILSKMVDGDAYVLIKNKLNQEQAGQISGTKGLKLERMAGRYYPQSKIASHVIGFVNNDGLGQYGLEGYYDAILKGERNFKEQPLSLTFFNPDSLEVKSLNGSDLHLTLDYSIQFQAESILKEAKESYDIDSGQVIVMEPETGRIVAMANYPNFDPNQYSKEPGLDIFQNSSIQKVYELGSIVKPITVAIGINEGKITPESSYTDSGCVVVQKKTICNYGDEKYGVQTMTQVLEKSLNTGAVFISQLISHDVYLKYFDKFGFSERTEVDLQGEVCSQNDNLKKGGDISFATASYGQGISLTPLQFLRGISAIANKGKIVKPYIVDEIENSLGDSLKTEPKTVRQVITESTARAVTNMMVSAVDNGFANKAKVEGYYIAGKTGTAQVAYIDKAGYYPDKTIHSFVGFAPALNPRFIAIIKLDNPKGNKSSSSTAAPLFAKLAKYILDYWQIKPDYL